MPNRESRSRTIWASSGLPTCRRTARVRSALNDFNSFFGNIENPVIRPDERGPLAWDAPNRVLVWASLTLPRGFAVFPVLDTRTGFPLSNVDADRNFVGPRNEVGRFPTFVRDALQLRAAGGRRTVRHAPGAPSRPGRPRPWPRA